MGLARAVKQNGSSYTLPREKAPPGKANSSKRSTGRRASLAVDGTWFKSIYRSVPPLIDRIRSGEGPALVEASVIRVGPHSSSDDQRKYHPLWVSFKF